ncbi:hypothetical protein QYM36_014967 [Artemia franciscana]|uniref:Uncharacterized protein n=1 Tax=Artemia franciscana TaxID=6661 RepID=A0AA88HDM1_ARTSF|nr:hypothetical protein QYM36_014967 [Artemia franciscana]
MYIQPYDLTFKYRAGTEIPVADALSRLHLPDIDEELHKEIEIFVHSAVTQQQTKPVPDRGGVTQTRSGRTIIKPTRLNL